MPGTVQHIAFNCQNRAAQEQFYTRHFGFQRARVFNAGEPGEFVMLRLGDCCLEFFQADADAPEAAGGAQPVGFKHLAFEVQDIESKREELAAAGIDIDEVIDVGEMVEGLKVCFFNDPEGNRIELMEGWHDQKDPPAAS